MTTFNDIHNVIDDMYNARSDFRSLYSNLTSGNSYTLETNITKAITKAVGTHKIALEIDLTLFTITVLLENETLAKDLRTNIEVKVDGVIRNFLEIEYSNNPKILKYLSNPSNKVMDIYTVGQSIKIML